jgi:hypothetical protein
MKSSSANQQFVDLGRSFIHGNLELRSGINNNLPVSDYDASPYNGKVYWPLGPFPAMVLTPFIIISDYLNLHIDQGLYTFVSMILIFFAIYKVARKFDYTSVDSSILAGAFCFSTSVLFTAMFPSSWYYAQVLSTACICMGIYEYFYKNRPIVVGTWMAFALLTRLTAGLGIVAFIVLCLIEAKNSKKIRSAIEYLSKLILPFVIAIIILMLYNFARFDSPFESGYNIQKLYTTSLHENREIGLLSLQHFPTNIYYAFFAAPNTVLKKTTPASQVLTYPYIKPNSWGMSMFFISPYLLMLFMFAYKDRISKVFLFTSAMIAIPIFLYYGIGLSQIGYRYGLDFLPFIFSIFIINYNKNNKGLSGRMCLLILFSCLFNFYIIQTW